MWRDHQGKQRCSQVPNWIRIRASVPVPSGPLLLPAGCSAELSQLLQTFPLLLLLLGHQLSAAEEESPHQGGGKTRKTLLSEEKQLSPLCPLTCAIVSGHQLPDGGTGAIHHKGNHCPFTLQTYSPLLVLTQLKF